MNVLKRPAGSSPASDLANLARRRAELEARKAKAVAALEAARETRRAVLAGDAEADLTKASAAVRDATDTLETIESVLADLTEETVAAEARLAVVQEADARAAAVKALGAYADKFDNAAADLDTALKAVGKAFAALVDAVPETLAVVDLDNRLIQADQLNRPGPEGLFTVQTSTDTARPMDLARVLLAEGLAKVCPAAFPYMDAAGGYRASLDRACDFSAARPTYNHSSLNGLLATQTAKQVATALVSARLRARAKSIAAGEAGPELADRKPWVPVEREPEPEVIPEVEIFAKVNLAWRVKAGGHATVCHGQWPHWVPADVADAAVEAGLALRSDTPEGAKAVEATKQARSQSRGGRAATIGPSDCHQIFVERAEKETEQ